MLPKWASACQYLIGASFTILALLKLGSLASFQTALLTYGTLIEIQSAQTVASIIIIVELVIGTSLLADWHTQHAVLGALLTSGIFLTVTVADAVGIIDPSHCGCFGGITFLESSLAFRLLVSLVLLSGSIICLVYRDSQFILSEPYDLATVLVIGVLAFILAYDASQQRYGGDVSQEFVAMDSARVATLASHLYNGEWKLSRDNLTFTQRVDSTTSLLGRTPTLVLLFSSDDCLFCLQIIGLTQRVQVDSTSLPTLSVGFDRDSLSALEARLAAAGLRLPIIHLRESRLPYRYRTPSLLILRQSPGESRGWHLVPDPYLHRSIVATIDSLVKHREGRSL